MTSPIQFFPQSILSIHRAIFLLTGLRLSNTVPVEGPRLWKENRVQVWDGSLPVFPVGLSVSMLLSTQLIMLSSELFFSGPTARCHTFWWRDTASTTEPPLSEADLAAWLGLQLVRILAKGSASPSPVSDIWGYGSPSCVTQVSGCKPSTEKWE